MIFNSYTFIIFLFLFIVTFWSIRKIYRKYLIFLSSLIFYGLWRIDFLILLLFSIFFNYYISLKIYKKNSNKKIFFLFSLFYNLFTLLFFKYFYFILEISNGILKILGYELQSSFLNIILPIGISFYTFQVITYQIDIYKNKIIPEKDFFYFANYIIFFPQLVAGPILRAHEIIWQFKKNFFFKSIYIFDGFKRIVFGLFLKCIIADNIGKYVEIGFNMDSKVISAVDTLTLSYLFGFQIYFDFSAYSHIAVGSANLMGIKFPENFNYPYHATNPKEFWNRWHITLSNCVKEYLYKYLLFSKKNKFFLQRESLNIYPLIVSWSIMGLWHGASWNFIFWGVWHSFIIIIHRIVTKFNIIIFRNRKLNSFFQYFFYMQLIMLSWILFRSQNLDQALEMYSKFLIPSQWFFMSLRENFYLAAFVVFVIYLIFPFCCKKLIKLKKINFFVYKILYVFFIFCCFTISLVFLKDNQAFVYFQF